MRYEIVPPLTSSNRVVRRINKVDRLMAGKSTKWDMVKRLAWAGYVVVLCYSLYVVTAIL